MCDTSMDETYRAGLLRVDLLLFTGKSANCKIYVNEWNLKIVLSGFVEPVSFYACEKLSECPHTNCYFRAQLFSASKQAVT